MAVNIFLNGVLQSPADYDGSAGASLVYRNAEGQGVNYSYSQELVLRGSAKDLIFSQVVNAPNPRVVFVRIDIADDCCLDGQGNPLNVFTGRIGYEGLRWCEEECTVTISAADASIEGDAITCLRNTLITDRLNSTGTITSLGEDEGRTAAYFRYCTETRPRSRQDGLMYIALILLQPALAIPLFLAGAIIGRNLVRELANAFTGCGNYHKAPYIYSYLKNACKLCGLNLQSSIFDVGGILHNVTRLDAPFEEGKPTQSQAQDVYRTFNSPNITAFDLLDTFKEVNIGYSVQGNTLIVERKDQINNTVWVDLTIPQNADLIQSQCYEFTDSAPPAGLVHEYSRDASDAVGNEAWRLFSGLIWDFNTPPNPAFRGIKRVSIPYAPVRSVDDNLLGSVNAFWSFYPLFFVDNDALIFERSTFSSPKLIATFSNSTDIEKANSPNGRVFVSPSTWLNQNSPVQGLNTFLELYDGRNNTVQVLDFEVVLSSTCALLQTFGQGRLIRLTVGGQAKDGYIEEVSYSFATREFTIKGKV
jgi:hypothetical protein